MKDLKTGFTDRLTAQQEAKKALLAKFKPKPAAPDPEFERLAEKRAAEKEALRQQHELAKAEIKLWVLTGDKVETAINIAKSAKLLTDDMFLVKLPAEGAEKGPEGDWGLGAQLTALEAVVQRAATPDPAAAVSRSSLQESTLREPLDDDPRRTPASLASDHLALVVEGATAMETILGNEELEQRFLKIGQVVVGAANEQREQLGLGPFVHHWWRR